MPFCFISFSVAIMKCMGEHRAFIVDMFIKNNKSVTATQRAFRVYIRLSRHDSAPTRNTTLLLVTPTSEIVDQH